MRRLRSECGGCLSVERLPSGGLGSKLGSDLAQTRFRPWLKKNKKIEAMKSFLKIVLASLVGLILFSILAFFFTMFMMIGAVSSMNSGSSSVVDSNSVLKIDINSAIDEYEAGDALDFASAMNFGKSNPGLNSIIKAIKSAKTDDKIKGIVLNFGIENSIGFSQVEEIRNALKDFKADTCNKFIYTYSNIYSQNAYWLSSLADSIFMQNVGSIDLRGLGTQLAFFKGTLDKLGVEMQVVRHGKFKSAVEPYVQNKMSSENKEQYSVLLNSMWGKYLATFARTEILPLLGSTAL